MGKRILKKLVMYSSWNKNIITATIIALSAAVILMVVMDPMLSLLGRSTAKQNVQRTTSAIEEELARLEAVASELSQSENIKFFLRHKQETDLLAYLIDAVKKNEISGVLVADEAGQVIVRTINPLLRGDLVHETTKWGQELSLGRHFKAVELGATVPLLLLAGQPLTDQGEQIGALVAAEALTDSFANKFRSNYFSSGTEIVFITPETGVTGSSFADPKSNHLLDSYWEMAFSLIQQHGSSALNGVRVDIDGKRYITSVQPLQGLDSTVGYVIVFTSLSSAPYSVLFGGIVALIFILSELLLHRPRKREKSHIVFLATTCGVIFLISTLLFVDRINKSASRLTPISQTIYNSTMYIQPESAIFSKNFEQRIGVYVLTSGEYINAVQASVDYDPTKLKVVEIITENSLCPQEFFIEKKVDEVAGNILVSCIIPNPGFAGKHLVAELIIQPLSDGFMTLKFGEDTQVNANDGLGTDVLRHTTDASYQVVDINGADQDLTILHSPSHPNTERWYSNRLLKFTWSAEGHSHIYKLSNIPLSNIDDGYQTAERNVEMEVEEDGIYYFNLAKTPSAGTLEAPVVSSYKIKIDSTPPEAPLIKASNTSPQIGEVVRLEFSSSDGRSGMQRSYYVQIDNGILLPVGRQLSIPFSEEGTHTVMVRAFDQANNFSDSTLTIDVR